MSLTLSDVQGLVARVTARFPDTYAPDFAERVADGRLQVFEAGASSVMIGTLAGTNAHIVIAAGDMEEIIGFEPTLCAWYRDHGARTVTATGRKGWWRVLPKRLGYRVADQPDLLIKDL